MNEEVAVRAAALEAALDFYTNVQRASEIAGLSPFPKDVVKAAEEFYKFLTQDATAAPLGPPRPVR